MESRQRHFGLSNNQLKLIAMAAMLLDHTGVILFPSVSFFKIVGRLSFPLFAYMIAEGALHTRHRLRYLLTLVSMGVICQTVFYIVNGSWHLNVLLTFSMALVLIFCIDAFARKRSLLTAVGLILGVGGVAFLTGVAPWLFSAYGYHIDYSLPGVLFPVVVYFAPARFGRCPGRPTVDGFWPGKLICTAAMLVIMGSWSGGLQWCGLCALPLLALYNGERGRWRMKYVFYIFYPAHFVLLYGISLLWH